MEELALFVVGMIC